MVHSILTRQKIPLQYLNQNLDKKNRKRITDGLWVRRSTRSINVKESENDAPVIKEFYDNKNDVTKHTINTDVYMNTAKNTNVLPVLSSSNDAVEPNADFTLRLEESPEKEDEIKVIKSNKQRNLNASDIKKETSGLSIEEKSDFNKIVDNEIVIPPIDVKMKNTRLPKKLDMPIKKNSKENTSIQLTKPVQTTLQSLNEHNLLKIKNSASLLISGNENQVSNLESDENTLNLMESSIKSIKSLPVGKEFIKIDPQLESVKYDKHLSTSEIESLLTNEIDSPVKNEDTIESNLDDQNAISNQGYDSISCKSLISLTECTDSSEDKSVERNSNLLNNKCLGVNPLFNNENVSLEGKNISLISNICQSDDEQMKVDTIMKKNCKEATQVVQCLIQNVVNEELMSNKQENGTNDSIIGDENYLSINNKDQTGIEFCHDSVLYKDDKDLSIRNSVDSKFNDSEDKDEDMKSTEESSSTDSNSHLMDLIGDAPIDNMSGSNEDISQTQYLNHKSGKLERLIEENNEIKDEKFSISQSRNPSLYNKTLNIYSNYESINSSKTKVIKIDESPEERANKESILGALGLQSLKTVNEETSKPKRSSDNYTGTLKAVIKLNRNTDKKYGGHKMIFKQGEINNEASGSGGDRLEYRICSELDPSTEGVPLTHLGDIASLKKSSLKSSRPQFDMNSSQNLVGAQVTANVDSNKMTTEAKDGSSVKESNLVIPEKSSSFSIHPGRLCSDVCTYCFGKFGSLDTPCHLAQFKNAERLNKILSTETHLAVDSCLCDGCFRYVDRKANCPASKSHSRKPGQRRGPLSGTNCSVQGCTQAARHSVRRKWLIKLKKSISKKLIIDLDKNPNMPFPLCSQHYYWVDYFTVCGICKKRLTRNHMFALGLEADELNVILGEDRIPVRVSDKLFLCKMCHYYSALRQKYRDISQMSASNKHYFQQLKKKILSYHDVPLSDSEEDRKSNNEEDNKLSLQIPKSKKKKSKSKSIDGQDAKKRNEDENSSGKSEKLTDQMVDYSYLESLGMTQEKSETPTVDYRSLESYEEQDCPVGFSNIASLLNPLDGGQGTVFPSTENQSRSRVDVKPTRIQVKFGNLNIGKLSNLNIGQDSRQGTADRPQYLPGERDLKLSSEFDFHGLSTPNVNWERCTSTIQFDSETKKLWQELQRPYGNQSSFLRHLLILEKHWRAGSLVYSEKPDPRAVKYITSVQNRVQAYEGGGCSSQKINISPPSPVIQLNVSSPVVRPTPVSTPTCITAPSPGLMKMQQVSAKDQLQKISNNMTFSVPTTQIVRPVDIQRLPVASKTVAVGPRPRKSNVKTASVGRGLGSGSPGSMTFQQFKRLQIQRAMIQNEKERSAQSKNIAQASTSNRPGPCPSPASNFVPLISDVRSLATSNKTWKESFNQSFNKGFPPQSRYTPILPKIPKALTVTQIVQPSTSSVLLHSTSLTIEKATNPSTKPATVLCPEKPSISVFREPTPNGNA
uniref:Uncharacterized protein n=1 Tax=Clastoptera arizonana TaxID=38151 RepID=A0A1B6EDV4_9HEMI